MTAVVLLMVSAVLWQEQFIDGVSSINQLYDYTIVIAHEGEKVVLQTDPQEEGYAAAWLSVDYPCPFPHDATLRLIIKVTGSSARIRFFCQRKGHSVYYTGEASVVADGQWQTVDISLYDAEPFYSSNFPASLTPRTEPALFLFVENEEPSAFYVEIDDISIIEQKEEK